STSNPNLCRTLPGQLVPGRSGPVRTMTMADDSIRLEIDPHLRTGSWSQVLTMRFMDVRLHFRHSAACTVASKTCCPPSIGGGYRPPPTCDAPGPAPRRSPGP